MLHLCNTQSVGNQRINHLLPPPLPHLRVVVVVVVVEAVLLGACKCLREVFHPHLSAEPQLQQRVHLLPVFPHLLRPPGLEAPAPAGEADQRAVLAEVETVHDEVPVHIRRLGREGEVVLVPRVWQRHLGLLEGCGLHLRLVRAEGVLVRLLLDESFPALLTLQQPSWRRRSRMSPSTRLSPRSPD